MHLIAYERKKRTKNSFEVKSKRKKILTLKFERS